MILRWMRESVRSKPYRPLIQACFSFIFSVVGVLGKTLKALFSLSRKEASIPFNTIKHIVVLRPDRIGDLVLSIPTLIALREAFPETKLTLICSEKTLPLMDHFPGIECVAVLGDDLVSLIKSKSALKSIKEQSPDLIVSLEGKWSVGLLCAWLGGRYSVGYDDKGMGWLFTHPVKYPFDKVKKHQVQVNWHLLQSVGLNQNVGTQRISLPVDTDAQEKMRQWLQKQQVLGEFILIHPGSRSAYTRWHAERFGELIEVLIQRGQCPIVLCGPGEKEIILKVKRSISDNLIIAEGLTLKETVALIAQAKLFIGNATGTMHIASAVCAHVIAIIGGTHPQDCPERWGPWGDGHVVVHKPPEEVIGRSTSNWLGEEGLAHIYPQDVIQAMEGLLAT